MNTLAAFNVIMAFCKAMIEGKQDPRGNFATAQEICKQFISLGEKALGRLLQRMSYISELLARVVLPPIDDFKEFLNKVSQIININTDARPFVPDGWKVVEHIKGGKFEWGPSKIILYISDIQKHRSYIEGNKLRKELKGKAVLNANVLDFLLANSYLIPEAWKSKRIFFWGTIYRHTSGRLVVRCLCWEDDDGWYGCFSWLDDDFFDSPPAALAA
jgi:hypothetical protein